MDDGTPDLRVAIAHEWLVKYAGSEHCVVEIRREFAGSRLLTTIASPPQDLAPELRGAEPSHCSARSDGGYRDRTGDLYAASVALSQLS